MSPFSCTESVLILINSNLNLIVIPLIFIFEMFNNLASGYSSLHHYSQYLLPNRFCYSHLLFLWGYLFVHTPVLLPLCATSLYIPLHFSLKQTSVRPTKEIHNISFHQLILLHFPGHQKKWFLFILLVPPQKNKTDFFPTCSPGTPRAAINQQLQQPAYNFTVYKIYYRLRVIKG